MTEATAEPSSLVAGDTWTWRRSLEDYSAADGWSLVYVFANATQRFTFTAAADGADHVVTVAASDSDDKIPGRYSWVAFAKKAGERHTVGFGECTITPNLEGARPYDSRTHARKVLDAIEALLEGKAGSDVEEYEIAGRSLKKIPVAELLTWRDSYRAEVASEERAAKIASGVGDRSIPIRVRFGRA